MNATHTPPNLPLFPQPARPHRRIDCSQENHLDRELRKLRGLSAEVGAACSVWLSSRGIYSRSWERSTQRGGGLKPAALDFHLPSDL